MADYRFKDYIASSSNRDISGTETVSSTKNWLALGRMDCSGTLSVEGNMTILGAFNITGTVDVTGSLTLR